MSSTHGPTGIPADLDRPVELELGAQLLDLLTWAMVGPRAVLAPRDALVLAREAPSGDAQRPGR